MKKIIAVIPITILFILLSYSINCNAATLNQLIAGEGYQDIFVLFNNNGTYQVIVDYYPGSNYYMRILPGLSIGLYDSSWYDYSNCDVYYANTNNPIENPDFDMTGFSTSTPIGNYVTIVCVKGSAHDDSGTENQYFESVDDYEDYINPPPPPPEPTWYEEMFDEFIGAIEGIASVVTGGFTNLVEAFTEFWVVPVGGDEGDMLFPTDIPIASPTPTPTPIQYQTVIAPTTDPQGNVIYQYKYVYNNPSGTPIITDSPPVNNNGGGDSFDYPYYENPDNNDNPYKLKIPWYLKLIFGNKIVDETTLDDSVNVIQDYMNDDDINDGVTTVYDGMSAIPTDWLILIGVIASIPLFGCLISRLLS